MAHEFRTLAGFVLLASATCLAQAAGSTSPAATQTQTGKTETAAVDPSGEIRGAFPTQLPKAIDSKKLKDGDTVVVQITAVVHSRSGMLIPYGSKVYGHITQSMARSKGDPNSTLAMVFDKIVLPGGQEIPFRGILQAVGPGLMNTSGPDTGAAEPGTMPTTKDATNPFTMAPPVAGAVSGPNSGVHSIHTGPARPVLNAESVGVLGIRNLQMDKDSVLTSPGKEVKLDNGTQLLIRAEIQIPVQ